MKLKLTHQFRKIKKIVEFDDFFIFINKNIYNAFIILKLFYKYNYIMSDDPLFIKSGGNVKIKIKKNSLDMEISEIIDYMIELES